MTKKTSILFLLLYISVTLSGQGSFRTPVWTFIEFDKCVNNVFYANDNKTKLNFNIELCTGRILFIHDKLDTNESKPYLDSIVWFLKANGAKSIDIWTDRYNYKFFKSTTYKDLNRQLKDYLVSKGIDQGRITVNETDHSQAIYPRGKDYLKHSSKTTLIKILCKSG